MWCIELGVSVGGGGGGRGWGGGGKEVSTASHDWSKVLMGERSHPPCEGWQGNVAGGNGFSQSAETEGRSLGVAVPHSAVRLPRLCQRLLSEQGCGDTHCICLSAFVWHWQRCSEEARVFDYYFGPFLPGWIDADTLAYSCTQIFSYQMILQLWNRIDELAQTWWQKQNSFSPSLKWVLLYRMSFSH